MREHTNSCGSFKMTNGIIPNLRLNWTNGFKSEAAQVYYSKCVKPNLVKSVWII